MIETEKLPQEPWQDYAIPEEWILKGNPVGKGMVLIENSTEGYDNNMGNKTCNKKGFLLP